MEIKFENGSEIRTISNEDNIKHGYIRGRRLTDKEYQEMIFNEQTKAEEKLDKILEILDLK